MQAMEQREDRAAARSASGGDGAEGTDGANGERYAGDAARWAAVCSRDAQADGAFYYGVRTTGVFCKPSCASRPALRANVSFHDTTAEAEAAGFRACKRCKPTAPLSTLAERTAMVERACRTIESSETLPSLEELAAPSGLSTFHFHRVFKAVTGVTPRSYGVARRAQRECETACLRWVLLERVACRGRLKILRAIRSRAATTTPASTPAPASTQTRPRCSA